MTSKNIEKALKEDLADSVNRFQQAVFDANCRLDLAISPGLWLLPSDLRINTESVYGYNNDLFKIRNWSALIDLQARN